MSRLVYRLVMRSALQTDNHATVLVVDGYASGRLSICAALAELEYSVIAAENAKEALEITHHVDVDAVIADLDDPSLRAVVSDLRARQPPIPTVLVTTISPASTTEDELILVKPLDLETLNHALRMVLRDLATGQAD